MFGRHLHSQIIWPFMLASIILGVVAALIGVGVLDRVVGEWVDGSAVLPGRHFESSVETHRVSVERDLRLLAGGSQFQARMASGSETATLEALTRANSALEADALMLVDSDLRVLAGVGPSAPAAGEALDIEGRFAPTETVFAVVHGVEHCMLVVGVPVRVPGDRAGRVFHGVVMSDAWLAAMMRDFDSGAVLIDRTGRVRVASAPASADLAAFRATLEEPDGALAVLAPVLIAEPGTFGDLRIGRTDYRLTAAPLDFSGLAGSDTCPHIVTIADASVAGIARRTATQAVLGGAAMALLLLIGMNWWVVQRVFKPLTSLSETVSRVADGDFEAKATVDGSAEVHQLAENLNRMTDSLQEYRESLTRKVSELATLYDMSRSLGTTLELDTLLGSVLESALSIFDVEVGYVAMHDRDTGDLLVRSARGLDRELPDEPLHSPVAEWVVREGRPLIFNPLREDEGAGRTDEVSGAVAVLCVPMLSGDGVVGAIAVGSHDASRRFTSDDVRLLATIANHAAIAVGNISLFSSVQEAYLATVRALAAAIDAKDPYTRGHSDGVAEFALGIGDRMSLSAEQSIALEMAAYLHDIGKIGISEDILLKPGKLTDAEMSQMRHHPLIGANILKSVAFPWPIAPIVRHHHEHFDGRGYPAGLRGDEIPLLARILTVADAFEAMVADRPYRRGRSHQEAILELRRCAGTQFDPRVVGSFIEVLESSDRRGAAGGAPGDEVDPGEAYAIHVAVCDGMFSSFRKLGGPRLASNLEERLNEAFEREGLPLTLKAGHLAIDDERRSDDDALMADLRVAAEFIAAEITRASGSGLVDHFITDALESLPARMRVVAERLGFGTLR